MTGINLDHNATSPIRPEVLEALRWALERIRGNASSLHAAGRMARALLEEARERVAAALDAEPEEVIFTSGGTESNNTALCGLAFGNGSLRRVAVSAVEHPSVYELAVPPGPLAELSTILPVDGDGRIRLNVLEEVLNEQNVQVVAVMHANNETGVIQPIDEVAKLCERANALLHVDSVQSVGKLPYSFRSLGAATASISGHKLQGPPGVGLLLVRNGVRLRPLLVGGPQERGLRPGTEPVALAWALAHAVEIATQDVQSRARRLSKLRDYLEQRILNVLPEARVNGKGAPRICNTSSILFPGYDAQALLVALDVAGVYVSTGSACSSGAATPSHVLRAMGLSEDEARSSLRFSLGPDTSREDVEAATNRIEQVLRRLRKEQS